MRAIGAFLLLSSFGLAVAKEKKGAKLGCSTCQSVAHLLVKARKEMMQGATPDAGGVLYNTITGQLFKERDTRVCNFEKLEPYAKYLGLKPEKMASTCKHIVPEKFEYKSAQDLKKLLAQEKPQRSAIANLLCVESAKCDKLWDKSEEPWQNWKKKAEL
eukprot:TRINITY_DN32908_c0_g1_i1.p1 TRINITY_DN32908_c0_g1~~TRINITY_DN32908_c0_g1_i1.p1  ORF type:complete len:159 (+),score=50.59 TRINITY_DN32908_c0_g1_i1:60-536(+)